MVNHMLKKQLGIQPKPRKTPEPTVRVRNRTGKEQRWGIFCLPADASLWTPVPRSLARRLASEPQNYDVWDKLSTPIFEAQSREECKPWEMVKRPRALDALLSIVILGHNQFEYTEKCFKTIYQHTKCRFEIVFVDQGSTDETVDIPTLYPKVRYFRSETNLGVAGGRNFGLKQIRGQVVCILDNDLEVVPEWDTRLLTALDSAPDVGMVGTHGSMMPDTGKQFLPVPRDGINECNILQGLTQLFWSDVYGQVGPLDENMVWHEDSEFSHRIFKAGYRLLCVPIDMPHRGNLTTLAVRGKEFGSRWDSDLAYMRKKLADSNIVYMHRTLCWPCCQKSVCQIAFDMEDALRDFGYTVFRRAHLKHEYPPLYGSTAFTMVFRGKVFTCYHAENTLMPQRYIKGMQTDHNLCVSQHVYDVLKASGMDPKKLIVCHLNHVDTDVFFPKREPRDKKKPFRFLWVGSSQPRKGIDVMLRAFGKAFDHSDNVELYIKDGIYGQREKTAEMIAEHPLKSKIIYRWGTISDMELADLYRSASFCKGAFVHPHRAEGFGKTPLEAAICGCRVGMTGWSATNEFFDKRTMTKFPYRIVHSPFQNHPGEPYYEVGEEQPEWAEPNAAAIAGWMRKVFSESINSNLLLNVSRQLSARWNKETIAREFVDTVHSLVVPPMRERNSDDRGWDYWHVGEGHKRFTDPGAIQFGKDQADLLVDLFDLTSPGGHRRAKTVLHVGAAQGHVVRALMDRGIQAFGLEAGKQGRIQARFSARARMMTGDMADPPNLHRDYDLIYVTDAIEHIEPELVRTALQNIFKALRLGGIACIIPDTLENPRIHLDPTHKTLRGHDWWAREFATVFRVDTKTDWQSIFETALPETKKLCWKPLVGRKPYRND